MKYYKSWQEALVEFINIYGHNYKDGYNLLMEFEASLNQNVRGAYFITKVGVI